MAVKGIKEMMRGITKLVEEEINKLFNKLKYQVREIAINTIRKNLKNHPTYIQIASGRYNDHFGFYPDTGETRMVDIVNKLIDTLDVTFIKVGNLITLEAFIDYQTLYDLNVARVVNNSARAKRGLTPNSLDWLEWLLEAGGRVVVSQYHIQQKDYSGKPYSRSEEAIMVEGGTWAVPASIAGTISSNWITESFADAEAQLSPNIKRFLIAEMKKL